MSAPYRGRVRTGCLGCRSAKVKCDEQHPNCRRCVRQSKDCVYSKKRSQELTASPTTHIDGEEVPTVAAPATIPTPSHSPLQTLHSPAETTSRRLSRLQASPSLLATLVSQDIYLCTTIDYIAAVEGKPSYKYFQQHFDSPFITPYDPANWITFKDVVLGGVSRSATLARATEAAQAVHRARRNALPHARALASYAVAYESLEDSLTSEGVSDDNFDLLFAAVFLLALVEMMLPEEIEPGVLSRPQASSWVAIHNGLMAECPQSSLTARLTAWLLICHAAARRSGNRGLLSASCWTIVEGVFKRYTQISPLRPVAATDPDNTLLAALTEPLFTIYVQTQIVSSQVAELSHYHRSRTTGEDQEDVATIMAACRAQLEELWHNRPTLMRHGAGELQSRFASKSISNALDLLCTLCTLIFDTEMVEMGRNLSQEQSTTAEARAQLKQMTSVMTEWLLAHGSDNVPPAFTRALLLCAIESTDPIDSQWAVANMWRIHDPVCYSDFFANFSKGLADTQRCMGRRVTTRWFGLQVFDVSLPFL